MSEVHFRDFCKFGNGLQKENEQFVGIKFDGGMPQIYFPRECFSDTKVSDDELREVFQT